MCGIIGVALKSGNAAIEAFSGLKRLEYRGYDSAGLAVCENGHIKSVKRAGGVDGLKPYLPHMFGATAIGHTRWATHGEPSDRNAHPHVSGKFALVHNGMIENYRELKCELAARGATFLSDTDSEVIVKLIERYYSGDALKAVASAVKRLKGSFALCVLCEGEDCIIAVKNKSPAVLGFSGEGTYIASDVPALPQSVKSVIFLQDRDIARISAKKCEIFNFDLSSVKRAEKGISLGQFAYGKGNYAHFMLKEIGEDGRTAKDTAESFLRLKSLSTLARYVKEADRIIITGCGTAYNAALVGKKYFDGLGVYCCAEIASELRYDLPAVTEKTLALAVSQSGETADTLGAAQALKDAGARIVAVTNCGYSAITRVAQIVVPVCAGAEICVAATKSYIGQIVALYLISRLGSTSGAINAAASEITALSALTNRVLAGTDNAENIARECAKSRAVFFLGRGIDYAVAVEAALKLKEVSYVFSDGYPSGELKHGTLALIDGEALGVFIICDKSLADKCENAVEQVVSRKGRAAVITTIPAVAEALKDRAFCWLLPECSAPLSPVLSSVALQLIAYRTAVMLGRNPDKPRNLAKSVTVE